MTVGVLGGLGPGATAHFLKCLVEMTPATSDQDHVETLVYNDPTVPDRTDAILGDGPSPEGQLIENAQTLDEAGCDAIVINSNTTHYYHSSVASSVEAEVPHLMQLVGEKLTIEGLSSVGIITTQPAIEMGLYDNVAEDVVYPEDTDSLMNAMYLYKQGNKEHAADEYIRGVESTPAHVDGYVIGCTDFSALSSSLSKPTVDALRVLVQWCIDRDS